MYTQSRRIKLRKSLMTDVSNFGSCFREINSKDELWMSEFGGYDSLTSRDLIRSVSKDSERDCNSKTTKIRMFSKKVGGKFRFYRLFLTKKHEIETFFSTSKILNKRYIACFSEVCENKFGSFLKKLCCNTLKCIIFALK
jgi:hypothetical protein